MSAEVEDLRKELRDELRALRLDVREARLEAREQRSSGLGRDPAFKITQMKIPINVIAIWLEIMSDEELIRFRKRLEMNLSDIWKREKRESLIDLFSAEIKRRKSQKQ
jgi:hypothetical protein